MGSRSTFAPEELTAEQLKVDSYEILTEIASKIPAETMAYCSTRTLAVNVHHLG